MSCWTGCPGCPDCMDDVPPSKRAAVLASKKKRAAKKVTSKAVKVRAAKVAKVVKKQLDILPSIIPPQLHDDVVLDVNVEAQLVTALSIFKELKLTPRPIQVEAIRKCLVEFAKPSTKYVVLEAPTGVGKSLIGVALSRVFGKSYFCTLTAQLQDQMEKDFSTLGMRVLKGRGKYRCEDARASCIVGKELYRGKNACPGPLDPSDPNPKTFESGCCPYLFAKQAALLSPLMMANYHSFLANVGQAADYGEGAEREMDTEERKEACTRPFMVLDECHSIEGFLLDQVGLMVDLKKLSGVEAPELPEADTDLFAFWKWLEAVKDDWADSLFREWEEENKEKIAAHKVDAHDLTKEMIERKAYAAWLLAAVPKVVLHLKVVSDPEERDQLRQLSTKMAGMVAKLNSAEDFIIERGEEERKKDRGAGPAALDPSWFAVKPLRVREYGHWVHGFAKKVLLMSATVLDAEQLVTNIGLDLKDGEFVQLGCVFPKENRPIRVYPMDQTFKSRSDTWPRVGQMVDRLMSHHSREKGLLLFPSNKMLWEVRSMLGKPNQSRLIIAIGDEREAKYKEHMHNARFSVLCASGYWEGADLKGDAARFAVIPAMPRPHFSGQIAARTKLEPRWYEWLTFTKFIQGLGRGVRSEEDECIQYVMDAKFVSEMEKTHSLVPDWIKEAVTVVNMGGDEDLHGRED